MMKSFNVIFATLLFTLGPGQAHAQVSATAQSKSQDEAAARFEHGVELYQDGALDAALIEFERTYELVSDYRVLYNLARVQTERHRYAEAVHFYEQYLSEGGSEIAEKRRQEVQHELDVLKGRVASLWVESNVPGAELFVNEVSMGLLPLGNALLINPGLCHVLVQKEGYESAQQEFKVASGDAPRLSLALVKSSLTPEKVAPTAVAAPAAARVTEEPQSNWTPFWVSATTAVVLGGAAGTFGVLLLNNRNQLDEEYSSLPADQQRVETLQKQGRTYAILADAFTASAVVATGFGIYFLVRPPKSKRSPTVGSIRDLKISPAFGGAALSGRF